MSKCSRVCGITDHRRRLSTARFMPPTPASIVLTKRSCPGTSPTRFGCRRRWFEQTELDGDAARFSLETIRIDSGNAFSAALP